MKEVDQMMSRALSVIVVVVALSLILPLAPGAFGVSGPPDTATAGSTDCPCAREDSVVVDRRLSDPFNQPLETLIAHIRDLARLGEMDAPIQGHVAQTLVGYGESERFKRLFGELMELLPGNYYVIQDYASGLAELHDPAAESWLDRAVALRPANSITAIVQYARWLLEHGRPGDALRVLNLQEPGVRFPGLHFYRGVALESLGRSREARGHYRACLEFNRAFPAPATLRTALGESIGVRYEGDPVIMDTCDQAKERLSQMIYSEARGEGNGGMAAAGWTARNRVFVTYPDPDCDRKPESSTYCDGYLDVLVDGQFTIGSETNADTDAMAHCVFHGWVPDPVAQRCAYGPLEDGTWCDGVCKYPDETGGFATGGYYFYSTDGSCAEHQPGTGDPPKCGVLRGKVCGNGGKDHCFYSAE